MTLTLSSDGLDVSVHGGKPIDGQLRIELASLCDRTGLVRLAWDGEAIAMRTPPRHDFGDAQVGCAARCVFASDRAWWPRHCKR